jgi:hypothetical protein
LNALSKHGFDANAISSDLASSGCQSEKDIQLFGSLEARLNINLVELFGLPYAGTVDLDATMGLLIDFVERYAVALDTVLIITIHYAHISNIAFLETHIK